MTVNLVAETVRMEARMKARTMAETARMTARTTKTVVGGSKDDKNRSWRRITYDSGEGEDESMY
jgi:hypothetical protein